MPCWRKALWPRTATHASSAAWLALAAPFLYLLAFAAMSADASAWHSHGDSLTSRFVSHVQSPPPSYRTTGHVASSKPSPEATVASSDLLCSPGPGTQQQLSWCAEQNPFLTVLDWPVAPLFATQSVSCSPSQLHNESLRAYDLCGLPQATTTVEFGRCDTGGAQSLHCVVAPSRVEGAAVAMVSCMD